MPANRVAWTPAGFAHQHRAHSRTDMRIVFLPPSLARLVPDRPLVFEVSDLAREILLALTGSRRHHRAAQRPACAESWSTSSTRRASSPCTCPSRTTTGCAPSPAILRERPDDASSLAELGQAIGASARTLSRLCHDELGMTFYEWRTQLRVYHALVLLADGHDTTYVAHACGWSNPSSFITAFTGLVGTTPGRYKS